MDRFGYRRSLVARLTVLALLALSVVLIPTTTAVAATQSAAATLQDQTGTVVGVAFFQQLQGEVGVAAFVGGLTPGFHGFHVHSKGECVAPFTSAGGHLNPGSSLHPTHAGDMPVLLANADGTAFGSFVTDRFTIDEILDASGDGSALIVHAGPDNYANIPSDRYSNPDGVPDVTTTATGDSGSRAVCGVVQDGGSAAEAASGQGYYMGAADGGVFAFGDAEFHGSMGGTRLNSPIVGMASTALKGGYWMAGADGGIFAFGDAPFHGSMGGTRLNQPVVGMAANPSGDGYWEVASDGGIFAFGDAPFRGSMGGTRLNRPVVGMAAKANVASATLYDQSGEVVGEALLIQVEGAVLVISAASLPAGFHGFHIHSKGECVAPFTSAGGHFNPAGALHPSHAGDMPVLLAEADGTAIEAFVTDRFALSDLFDADGSALIVHADPDNYANIPSRYTATETGTPGPDTTSTVTGDAGGRTACGAIEGSGTVGYWEVASDGGIFAFGGASFLGSMGGTRLNSPVVGMAATPSGMGYWLFAADGGVFAYGDAEFFGSMGGTRLNSPIVGGASTSTGEGYWLFAADGGVFAYGDAEFHGSMGGTRLNSPVVGGADPIDTLALLAGRVGALTAK